MWNHLGSTSATQGNAPSNQTHYPFGGVRTTTGNLPTDYGFTGQKLDASDGLMYYNARYYDAALGRFISADTVVPKPINPQDLNRYAYVNNNPLRYIDPSGHWTDEELEGAFGEDWRDKYFGKDGVFKGRDNLLDYLTSDKTNGLKELGIIRMLFEGAAKAYEAGIDFNDIDALGMRIAITYTAGGVIGANGEAILNLTAGQFGVFVVPEGGFGLSAGVQGVIGISLLKNAPSNDNLRGTFQAVGVLGGEGIAGNAEVFWTAPMNNSFKPFDGTNGIFAGIGTGAGGGIYSTISYGLEVYRSDAKGSRFLPHEVDPITALGEIGGAIRHDILEHPIWPWSPFR